MKNVVFHLAAESGRLDVVESLLELEIDINEGGSHNKVTCCQSSSRIHFKLLLHWQKIKDYGALHKACSKGHDNIVQYLLTRGADVNLQTEVKILLCISSFHTAKCMKKKNDSFKVGWTPLMCASYRGQLAVMELLVTSGADVNLKNNVMWSYCYFIYLSVALKTCIPTFFRCLHI